MLDVPSVKIDNKANAQLLQYLSSLRLTAYVVKVFAMANNLVAIPTSIICDAIKFLILNAQQSNGLFKEVGRVFYTEMTVRKLLQ